MPDSCVLIAGPTLTRDEALSNGLQSAAAILKCRDHSACEAILERAAVEVLLLEIESADDSEVAFIKKIKNKFPEIEIIVIDGNGNRDLIAKAFAMGARDAFPKPYDSALVVERVKALLRQR